MLKEKYPILEFDNNSPTVIDVRKNVNPGESLPERCVITFFGEAVREYVASNNCPQIGSLVLETFVLPIYEVIVGGEKIALIHALGSAPYAAGQIEKLTAMGCRKFIVCGGCGTLERGSKCGDIYIPVTAVRDEGTSYHYIAPSREIDMDVEIRDKICSYLMQQSIPYQCVKTWTTDAMYRETVDMIELRKSEGCVVVEMECSAYFAVAQYKKVKLGQILYAGDDLSGKKWDSRNWKNNYSVRLNLLSLAIEIVSKM